jgi:valyl-tRNA synthetase
LQDADKEIIKALKAAGRVVDNASLMHSYPFCWRSDTPLIYKAVPSWFVRVEEIKPQVWREVRDTVCCCCCVFAPLASVCTAEVLINSSFQPAHAKERRSRLDWVVAVERRPRGTAHGCRCLNNSCTGPPPFPLAAAGQQREDVLGA